MAQHVNWVWPDQQPGPTTPHHTTASLPHVGLDPEPPKRAYTAATASIWFMVYDQRPSRWQRLQNFWCNRTKTAFKVSSGGGGENRVKTRMLSSRSSAGNKLKRSRCEEQAHSHHHAPGGKASQRHVSKCRWEQKCKGSSSQQCFATCSHYMWKKNPTGVTF